MAAPEQMQQAGQSETEEDNQCSICLGTLCNAACVPTCFHRFCFPCIQRWARNMPTCPLCRQPFDRLLHTVRANDGYQEYVVVPSARPQHRYNLRPRPTQSRFAAERRAPEGRDAAAVAQDAMARQAAGEY